MLKLMISADNFTHIHVNKQGLQFTFRVPYNDKLRLAKFVPMRVTCGGVMDFTNQMYQIRLTVEALSNGSFVTINPYDNTILHYPDRLVDAFETKAKVAVTFC